MPTAVGVMISKVLASFSTAVLVDAGLVGKGVGPDNGLIGLHHHAR